MSLSGLRDFIQSRIPLQRSLLQFLRQPLPAQVGWLHTLGGLLLFLTALQFLSGVVLALFFAPTPDHAWQSLRYLQDEIPSGRIVRGLHVWGAGLIIVVCTLHLLRVSWQGAYKAPRELNWLSGMLAFLIMFAFAFTGLLLPWDQKGYWATQVGTQMLEQVPLLGPPLADLLRGGEALGAFTLSRFFVLHVILLPALLLLLLALHVYLLRVHGVAPAPRNPRSREPGRPFYPDHLFRETVVWLLGLLLLLVLCFLLPPSLDGPADPTDHSYAPRPEWYFLAHYELLRWLEGNPLIPILVIPSFVILLLLSLPWWDRSPSPYWRERKLPLAFVLTLFAAMYAAVPYSKLAHPPHAPPSPDSLRALPLPSQGDRQLLSRGRQAFQSLKCVQCHALGGVGGRVGPDLEKVAQKLSPQAIREQILDPKASNPKSKMPSYRGKIDPEDLEAVLAYLQALSGGGSSPGGTNR